MNLLREQSIRRYAAALIVLLFVPIAGGAAWLWLHSSRARDEEGRRQASSSAAAAASSFDQFLGGVDALASVLAADPSVVALNRAACDRLFAAALRGQPRLLNILLSAPDETIQGSGLPTTGVKPPQPLPQVKQVLAAGRPAVGELSLDPLTHRPTVILGYPVRSNEGTIVAVLAVGLDLSRLQSTFAGIPLPDGSTVALTSPSGLVLARNVDADRYIGTSIDVPGAPERDAPAPAVRQIDVHGVARFVASAAVGSRPWLMRVAIPASGVAGPIGPDSPTLAILAIALLGWAILAFSTSGRLARQLDRLSEAARRMARGEPTTVPLDPPLSSELAELQLAFGAQADYLHLTRAELEHQIEQEHKVREMLETLQRHIVRQERLAAVGLLLSGVAHELNNPLQAIMGAAELLEQRADLSPDAQEDVALVNTQVQRAAEIIRNLSRFGTYRPSLPTAIDIQEVVSEVVQLRGTDLEAARITCEVHTEATGKIFASFTEIEQVILNFVINAQQSIQAAGISGGLIVIRSSDVDGRVRLEVIDNGPGVAPEDAAKLFQPFFTTKPVGEGTGLGLSVSHGIIESYGGTIGHRPNESGGAVFYFELPRV